MRWTRYDHGDEVAAMGFAFLVRSTVYDSDGDYALLRDTPRPASATPERPSMRPSYSLHKYEDKDPTGDSFVLSRNPTRSSSNTLLLSRTRSAYC